MLPLNPFQRCGANADLPESVFKSGFSDSETASADVHFAPHEWQEGEDSDYDGSDDGNDDDDDAQMSHSTSAAGDEENGSESAGKKGETNIVMLGSKVNLPRSCR